VNAILSNYRRLLKKLTNLEKDFDFFMKSDRSKDEKNAYAQKANLEYFSIKSEIHNLRLEYAMRTRREITI